MKSHSAYNIVLKGLYAVSFKLPVILEMNELLMSRVCPEQQQWENIDNDVESLATAGLSQSQWDLRLDINNTILKGQAKVLRNL